MIRAHFGKYRDDAIAQRKETENAKRATASAFRSRGELAQRIVRAAAIDDRRSIALHDLAQDPDVRRWATRASMTNGDDG